MALKILATAASLANKDQQHKSQRGALSSIELNFRKIADAKFSSAMGLPFTLFLKGDIKLKYFFDPAKSGRRSRASFTRPWRHRIRNRRSGDDPHVRDDRGLAIMNLGSDPMRWFSRSTSTFEARSWCAVSRRASHPSRSATCRTGAMACAVRGRARPMRHQNGFSRAAPREPGRPRTCARILRFSPGRQEAHRIGFATGGSPRRAAPAAPCARTLMSFNSAERDLQPLAARGRPFLPFRMPEQRRARSRKP